METIRETVREPAWFITWSGREASTALGPYLVSLTYTDAAHGESDELTLTLEDREGGFMNDWYVTKGDVISARIGYVGEAMVDCGLFEVEEVGFDGPPSIVNIRALAAGVSKTLRTERSKAYEGKTLRQIAQEIAGRHGFTVVGEVADVELKRATQNQEKDLSFLKRLAEQHGHLFSVKGDQLVFARSGSLTSRAPSSVFNETNRVRWSFRDKGVQTYKAAHVAYHDPATKRVNEHTQREDAPDGVADTLKITTRAESKGHAALMSKSALDAANDSRFEGTLTMEGDPLAMSGNTVAVAGFGKLDGTWFIDKSTHTITRGEGYSTSLEVKRGA